jgi:hypothetical protein
MDQKDLSVQQHEQGDGGSHSSSAEEKGVAPQWPINDEDYVVTFKTWIVVAILASSYGVSRELIDLHQIDIPLNFLSGFLLDCS